MKLINLYLFTLEIRNGEYEYEYDKVIEAENYNEAEKKAEQYASNFYGGESYKMDDAYFFHGGCVCCSVHNLQKVTKEKAKDMLFSQAFYDYK